MTIKFYRKNLNMFSKFKEYKIKIFKFYPTYIYFTLEDDNYFWHKLSRYTIKELYYTDNIIFIHWEKDEKIFYFKFIINDKTLYNKIIKHIKGFKLSF